MKRKIHLICFVLVLITATCSLFLPVCANAEGDTYQVTVDVVVLGPASIAENSNVDFCLINIATEEEYCLTIPTSGINNIYLPLGEYNITKVTLTDDPSVEFEFYAETIIVTEDYTSNICSFSLKSVLVTEENQEVVDEIVANKNKMDQATFDNLIAAGLLILWIALGIYTLVTTIKGKKYHDESKRPFYKAKGRFLRHIFFALISGAFLGAIFGDGGFSWIFAVIGAGFPFGIAAVSMFYIGRSDDDYAREREREGDGGGSGVIVAILMTLALLLGAIALPIIFVYDIIQLVKTYKRYREHKKYIAQTHFNSLYKR